MRELNVYFPGDPPGAEVFGIVGGILLAAVVVLAWGILLVTKRHHRTRAACLGFMVVPGLTSCLALGVFATEVTRRHFGDWAQLKALLQQYGALVSQRADGPGGSLSPERYRALQRELRASAPTFQFTGTGEPVRLRLMMSVWPYVGVDFGQGANAVFNPITMVCNYSD